MNTTYDVVVIGAGPGGYVAAIYAAQLGLSVCVVEKDTPGGVCLNWGCIPSKSLIHHATEYKALKDMEQLGIGIDRTGFKYSVVQAQSRSVAKTLANGITALLRKNKVKLISATASVAGTGKVALKGEGLDTDMLRAKNILVATGSRPMSIPGFEFDEQSVLSSDAVLAMTELPRSLIVLGAGAIGCEFAYIMNAFGVQVTLVEMGDHILPTEDAEAAQVLDASLRQSGVDIHTGARATSWCNTSDGVQVTLVTDGVTQSIQAEKILAAFGRKPNTDNLGLEAVGVKTDARGYVETGDYYQTAVAGIFAIGDIVASPALAHVASREGEIAVRHMAGRDQSQARVDLDCVPSGIYCEPQIAGFGLREDHAASDGIAFKKTVFPYRGIGKSVATGKTEGLVKVLTDPDTGEFLGAHIAGANATELIHELLLAKTSELLPEDVVHMIHAHPTLSEAISEAVRGVHEKPIHI